MREKWKASFPNHHIANRFNLLLPNPEDKEATLMESAGKCARECVVHQPDRTNLPITTTLS